MSHSDEAKRICTGCGDTKPDDCFYRHPFGRGGRQSRCMECAKEAARSNRAARIEHYRAFDRRRAKEPVRVEQRKIYAKEHPKARPERDPVKREARIKLGNALRDGQIIRPTECDVCSIPADVHGHHDDYTKPLDVIWCCTACHALIHACWRAQKRMAA